MARLPRVSGRRLVRALGKAGFQVMWTRGDHAFLHNPDTNRKAVVPLTRKTLAVGTIASALRQAGLTADDLRNLLN